MLNVVILLRKGNIGNQLFQYYAAKKLFPASRIVLVGYDQLQEAFDGLEVDVRLSSFLRLFARFGVARLEMIHRRIRLFQDIREVRNETGDLSYSRRSGIIPFVSVISDSCFQVEAAISAPAPEPLRIKPLFLTFARQAIPGSINRDSLFFVCVRRGDYVYWPSRANPAVLPLSYYKQQMDHIRNSCSDATFLVISDDPSYVYDVFLGPDIHYFSGDFASTLAAMSLCSAGGILSASSFCWWGAYFCRRGNPAARFVAPRYWIRHSECIWEPPGIATSWIDYVDVPPSGFRNICVVRT